MKRDKEVGKNRKKRDVRFLPTQFNKQKFAFNESLVKNELINHVNKENKVKRNSS
jgi:hypothetical protein